MHKGILPLFYRLYKPFCRFHFLFYKIYSFTVGFCLFFLSSFYCFLLLVYIIPKLSLLLFYPLLFSFCFYLLPLFFLRFCLFFSFHFLLSTFYCFLLFYLHYLFYSSFVASTLELGFQPSIDYAYCNAFSNDPAAHCYHVGVVVGLGHSG